MSKAGLISLQNACELSDDEDQAVEQPVRIVELDLGTRHEPRGATADELTAPEELVLRILAAHGC